MTRLRIFISRVLAMFRGRRIERRLDEEVRAHIDMLAEEYEQRGMTREDAYYAARRSFGGVAQMKEAYRDSRALPMLDSLVQDLRYSVRMLRKSPAFTVVAIVSLALGIGANTAIFSLINAVMLRELPVDRPGDLVVLNARNQANPALLTFPMYRDLRARQQVFTDMFATAGETAGRVTIHTAAEPVEIDNVRTDFVTASYWSVLGLRPFAGRFFTAEDDNNPGSSETQGSVAVLSYGFWDREFGRNRAILGTTVLIGRAPCRVIGVTARDFTGEYLGTSPDIWVPLIRFSAADDLENRRGSFTAHMARLKPGVSREQAQTAMTVLFQQLQATPPYQQALGLEHTSKAVHDYSIALQPGATGLDYNRFRRTFSKPLYIVMAVVGLLLLIACANVANLLLARATSRQREIGIRLALGCGRRRLVRQLLTESLLLAGLGSLVGLVMAYWGSGALLRMVQTTVALEPDTRVVAFMLAMVILTGIGFGIAPALKASRLELGRFRPRMSRTLVAVQVALSLVLLVGAGLLLRSMHNLHTIDLGFRPEHVLIFDLAHNPRDRDPAAMARIAQQAHDRVKQLAGVQSASLSGLMIFSTSDISSFVNIQGYTPGRDELVAVRFNSVSPDYFKTVGMAMLQGRGIEEQDTASSPGVAVINESMARRYFAHSSALGRTIELTPPRLKGKPFQIVGVVRDAKYNDLRAETKPMFYVPLTQLTRSLRSLEIRTMQPASALIGPVRRALLDVSRDIMIRRVFTLTDQVDRTLASERLITTLSTFFGALALLLASVGLYGILSYAVAQRTAEIGVRIALGASARHVLGMVLRESIKVVLAGTAAGLVLALASTRLVSVFLYGLSPTDLTTILSASAILLAVSLIAGYLPARRATKVDPMMALRYE